MDNNYNDIKNYATEQIGKIYNFDGEAGVIISNDGEYPFSKRDIYDGSDLAKGDIVTFRINHLAFPDETIQVAKFIRKDKNEDFPKSF